MKAIPAKRQENGSKLENLKKNTNSSLPVCHGGARENAGRKPKKEKEAVRKMKAKIEKHGLGTEVVNGKKQTRVEILLMVLFREGAKGNISAIREYFDRQIGKVTESIELGNKEGRVFQVNITTIGDKQNGDQLETNEEAE